jgi:hypothetical protein
LRQKPYYKTTRFCPSIWLSCQRHELKNASKLLWETAGKPAVPHRHHG